MLSVPDTQNESPTFLIVARVNGKGLDHLYGKLHRSVQRGHCPPAWDCQLVSDLYHAHAVPPVAGQGGALDATGGWELLGLCHLVLFLALVSLWKIQKGGRVVWA